MFMVTNKKCSFHSERQRYIVLLTEGGHSVVAFLQTLPS